MRQLKGRAYRLAVVMASLSIACSDSTAPQPETVPRLVLIAGSMVRAIDIASGQTAWTIPLDGIAEGVAAGAQHGRVFVGVKGSSFERELLNIDLCRRLVEWRLDMFGAGGPNQINDVGLSSGEVMGVDSRARRIFLWRSWRDDTLGIASLGLDQLTPSAFSGPWSVRPGGILPLWPGFSNEALAVVASRDQGNPRGASKIYLLDPTSLNVRDSIDSSDLGERGNIWSVRALSGGGTILVGGPRWLVTYDTDLRQLVRSVALPTLASVNMSPDGETVILTNGGGIDSPGSGLLHVFDSRLSHGGTIDVSTPLGGHPGGATATSTRMVAFSDDGRTAYVLSGTPAIGPLYTPQSTRIIVVDLATRTVIRVHDLGGHELGWLSYLPACA